MKTPEGKEEGHLRLPNGMKTSASKIAGVDEVGKGSLFGPVFAGAVILNKSNELALLSEGLKDSKKLTAQKRNYLVPLIQKHSIAWSLGQASAEEIDRVGIRIATERAMLRALEKFSSKPELIIVDGRLPIRLWQGKQITQVKGESHFPSIAAASVLAKEARDALIKRLSKKYFYYGLERNKGYGTKLHMSCLGKQGTSNLHRKSFLSKLKTA